LEAEWSDRQSIFRHCSVRKTDVKEPAHARQAADNAKIAAFCSWIVGTAG
jgi:hypothetical protein